jgi:hypothetical protein
MTVPSFAEVNRIGSPAVLRELIRRDDLPDDQRWWSAVISVGQTGLLGAESGRPDAEEWASVLVEALDVAAQRPAFGLVGTVHRRMMACIAAMRYFGERAGDPARDPELVHRHITTANGGTPEAYLDRYREVLARTLVEFDRARAGGGDMREVSRARSWLDSTLMALGQMCDELAPRVTDGPLRDEAVAWCAVLPQIDAVREAAKASRQTPPVPS